jgi:chemotaxis protein CheX|uniref:Chemotaxis protein CheX n=1 Tax=Gracilinema caldarium TaxID=215591 RepID=A0A7C3HWN4_9SPIR
MNVKYINPFIIASQNVFRDFIKTEVKPGKPEIFNPESGTYDWDISGIIGLAGEVIGLVVISFPKVVALKILSKMLGRPITIIDADVTDIIGELVNIIAGNAKQGLEEFKVAISLPSIIEGKKHKLSGISGVPMIVIPLESEFGRIDLIVSFKNLDI